MLVLHVALHVPRKGCHHIVNDNSIGENGTTGLRSRGPVEQTERDHTYNTGVLLQQAVAPLKRGSHHCWKASYYGT
jgi:hypothetical protein